MTFPAMARIAAIAVSAVAAVACGGDTAVTPAEGQAPVDGGTVYYSVTPPRAANGGSCVVVLIGGGSAMDVRQWGEAASWLQKRNAVVRFDPRGVGRSPLPAVPYSDAVDLAALLDFLDIDRVAVVGNSSGGGVALEFAAIYPERVSAVAVVAPFIPGYPISDGMRERITRIGGSADRGAEAFIEAILADTHFLPSPDQPEARQLARRLIADNFDKMMAADVELAIELDPPLVDQLDRVSAPLLVMVGTLDHPDLHERSAFIDLNAPQSRIVTIERAGHTVHLEQPLEFGRELRDFLADYCGP